MVATIFQNGHKPHQQKAHTHRQRIKDMLPSRKVGYSPDMARAVGGATIGLFLSQLLFLSDKGADSNGWVYKSEAEMKQESGLTKREQQTARRKLLALGVIQVERRGWKNTYHFRIAWERLERVIEQFLRGQTVATEPEEQEQTVSTEPIQNVPTQPPQNVATERPQNAAALYRDNNREKQPEKTDRENLKTWQKALEQLEADLPPGEAEARLSGTTLIEVTDTAARIGVNNPFAIAWIERRLYGHISKAMKQVIGKDLDLQFIPS
jgi:hypothetical protein